MRFIGYYNRSVVLTYIGIFMSLFGMLNVQNLKISVICLILAGLCDLFDGPVARTCKRTKEERNFGIQIDSLADVISCIIFPVIILNEICGRIANGIFLFIVISFYVLAGIIRLAFFNIITDGDMKYYRGLPVTYIALILPVIFVIFNKFSRFPYIVLAAFLILSFLFVLDIRIKKPGGIWYGIFIALAVVVGWMAAL